MSQWDRIFQILHRRRYASMSLSSRFVHTCVIRGSLDRFGANSKMFFKEINLFFCWIMQTIYAGQNEPKG